MDKDQRRLATAAEHDEIAKGCGTVLVLTSLFTAIIAVILTRKGFK